MVFIGSLALWMSSWRHLQGKLWPSGSRLQDLSVDIIAAWIAATVAQMAGPDPWAIHSVLSWNYACFPRGPHDCVYYFHDTYFLLPSYFSVLDLLFHLLEYNLNEVVSLSFSYHLASIPNAISQLSCSQLFIMKLAHVQKSWKNGTKVHPCFPHIYRHIPFLLCC